MFSIVMTILAIVVPVYTCGLMYRVLTRKYLKSLDIYAENYRVILTVDQLFVKSLSAYFDRDETALTPEESYWVAQMFRTFQVGNSPEHKKARRMVEALFTWAEKEEMLSFGDAATHTRQGDLHDLLLASIMVYQGKEPFTEEQLNDNQKS